MFRLKTAWFSSSVLQQHLHFWILEGGSITDWRTADYLFSEDATCPDTLRIFKSNDYLCNKVTVFHSLFLSDCEKRESVKSVCIGHYVLPPASVQDEMRKVVGRLIWERDGEQSVAECDHMCLLKDECNEEVRSDYEPSNTSSSGSKASPCGHLRSPVGSTLTAYVSMDSLEKYSGDLCDFHPRHFRCLKCKAHLCLTQT